jgi:hypothetical protein
MDIGLAIFWTVPIGISVFLFGMGVLLIGIAKIRGK